MFSFSKTRGRLSYANVVATLALVFAMSGGALAATHYLITSTKQISPKVLKALQGKNGGNGLAGPAGLQGSKGETGSAGVAGKNGENGSAGSNGKNGESVQLLTLLKGNKTCEEELPGVEFKVGASSAHVCTGVKGEEGKQGTAGKEGSPWTAGGTLPSGKTETGTWSTAVYEPVGTKPQLEDISAAISFPIPLAEGANPIIPVYVLTPTEPAHCKDEATGTLGTEHNPKAAKGYLCVFPTFLEEENIGLKEVAPLGPVGALVVFESPEPNPNTNPIRLNDQGTWAVTAE